MANAQAGGKAKRAVACLAVVTVVAAFHAVPPPWGRDRGRKPLS